MFVFIAGFMGKQAMNNTLQYYNEHAELFTADTQSSDMTEKYAPFLNRLPDGAHILDLGCGSGRDSQSFYKWAIP
jgi:cyclopropane fatty-acyl-phospholipid synthase-like methyltransferase